MSAGEAVDSDFSSTGFFSSAIGSSTGSGNDSFFVAFYSTLIFSENVTEYWDGRTHLGELVMPGTYILHLESSGFNTGKSYTAMAPIIVGARLK